PDDSPESIATFVGLVCLEDPPKAGVKEALYHFKELGLRLTMITGDQKATAAVTAKNLGIANHDGEVWTQSEFKQNGNQLPPSVRVLARTKPEDKLAVVDAMQARGEVVAMVGDGMNDAPALQRAD